MNRVIVDRALRSIQLLVDRRAVKFVIIDTLVLLNALLIAIFSGERGFDFYTPLVIAPLLILGVPIMADAVALERRAGTLDLVLSAPGSRFYFERRIGTFCILMLLQAWMLTILFRFFGDYPLWPPITQSLISVLFLGAAVLFWALRVRTTGGVIFLTYTTAALLGSWFFFSPVFATDDGTPVTTEEIIGWVKANLVIGVAAVIFYLYAAERLSKPEEILSA